MKKINSIIVAILLIFAASCKQDQAKDPMNRPDVSPPVAEKIVKELEKHGDKRIDNYYWMRFIRCSKKRRKSR